MAPVVMLFKESVSNKQFRRVSTVFLVLASISGWTSKGIRMRWDVGQTFEYLGYFMVGYCICQNTKKSNSKGIFFICCGLLVELCTAVFLHWQNFIKITENNSEYSITDPFSPLIVLASVLIFYGFVSINFNKNISGLSAMSFYIYLFHAGVWTAMQYIIKYIKGGNCFIMLNPYLYIPLCAGSVFIISYIATLIYVPIEKKMLEKLPVKF